MFKRKPWRRFFDKPLVEWGIFALGVLLIIAGLVISPVPGPGGIFLIAPGLALVLKTSMWAKRHYVRLKKKRVGFRGRQVVIGDWTDWALRRRSAKRRKEVAEAKESGGSD
jgi:amino acid transporter